MRPYLLLDLITDLGMIRQEGLGILPALADLISFIGKPCAALVDDIHRDREIQNISLPGDSLSEHDVEFRFLKRRSDLVLHHLHAGAVSHDLTALLERLNPADIQPDCGIELKCPAAGGGFRISEHDAHLLTQLVDENHRTVRLADHGSELTQRLGHQSCLQANMRIAHVPVDLRLRHQSRNRVNDNNVNRTGTDHRFGDLQRLLSVIRL